jgi:M6 family metalloprotease-like protein
MKKILLTLMAAAACLGASAVPAIPTPQKATQPDGTEITVRIKGDEFHNYLTTEDGYTIVLSDNGFYYYGTLINDQVVPSKIVARDAQQRTASDKVWLEKTGKNLKSAKAVEKGRKARVERDNLPKYINYNNFHGLVILVNFSDSKFTRTDVNDFYNHMINDANYTGYTNEDGSYNPYGSCTGSVRDYFYDNSNGVFAPHFDVVGPIDVNFKVNEGNSKASQILLAAAKAADSQVDYSQYDIDNDGYVDLIYFIVADTPSSSDPSKPYHLWPHRGWFGGSWSTYDGKKFRDYACSAEYIYAKSNGIFDGIGTICHEFSHVLGLPDLYDTNENNDGTYGEAQHPGEWDLMAGGNYQNNARTPVAYSLYDRYSTGFANYQVITAEGDYELNPIGSTGEGYILKSPQNKEIFLIENRQRTKWDLYAPGHGMMVARVDSTNASVWDSNGPNADAQRLYYELLRAGNSKTFQSPSDPFPGTRGVAMLTNDTEPNLLTYAGLRNAYNIVSIVEDGEVVKFKVVKDGGMQGAVEDFEPMPATTDKNLTGVQGSLVKWDFNRCYATTPSDATQCNGNIAIAMPKPSVLTMAEDVAYKIDMITFDVYNPNNSESKYQLQMSTDGGQTWETQISAGGETACVATSKVKNTFYFPMSVNVPARFRINCSAGSTKACYVDDFTIYNSGAIDASIPGDVNGDGVCNSADVTALYQFILNNDDSKIVNGDQNGDDTINSADVTAVYKIILGGE